MFDLKPLNKDAIPAALEKAMRYRLLNEPAEAESICLDILHADSDNQEAQVILLLALTDQFTASDATIAQADEVWDRLRDPYERAYYAGIINERRAKAKLAQSVPGARFYAYDLFLEAMRLYELADANRPANNDDARLRWNTCARIIMRNKLVPRPDETKREPPLE